MLTIYNSKFFVNNKFLQGNSGVPIFSRRFSISALYGVCGNFSADLADSNQQLIIDCKLISLYIILKEI